MIAFKVLYAENKNVYSAYTSKHNSKDKKQVHLLMTQNEEGWYFIAKQKLPE